MDIFAKFKKIRLGFRKTLFLSLASLFVFSPLLAMPQNTQAASSEWKVKSVDTQIISKCWDNVSQSSIDTQVSMLKSLGVNYIAVGTPYDRPEEMKKWVDAIHNAGLNVWFRSHWLNWEGDEGQPKNMSTEEYLSKTHQFILDHPEFFKAGDSFAVSVEAENVGIGSGTPFADWNAYRKFMSDEIDVANDAFSKIGLGGQVHTNWLSTNGWITDNVLTPELVNKMGLITVDHYSPQGDPGNPTPVAQLASDMSNDLDRFYAKWQKPIMIGEWGYHIGGEVSDDLQRQATEAVYNVFASKPYIYGVNWWDHMGNQTRIINDASGTPTTFRPATDVIKHFYTNNADTDPAPAPNTEPTPTPEPTTGKMIANFEGGMEGFDQGTIVNGALEIKNPQYGSSGSRKNIEKISLSGAKYLEMDIDLRGNKILSGDASAVYFEQGGWKWVSLANYVENSKNGFQHVKIPLTDMGVDTNGGAVYFGVRFWNDITGIYRIDNIYLTDGTTTTDPGTTEPAPAPVESKILANFESGLDGFNNGVITNGMLDLTNPKNGSVGSEKKLDGMKFGDYTHIELDIDLHGAKLLKGDASALYFEQGGWKWVSLYDYVENPNGDPSGWQGIQRVSIPISAIAGLDKNSGIAHMGLRFWNHQPYTYSIDNISLAKR